MRNRTVNELQSMIDRSSFHQLFNPVVISVENDPLQLTIKVQQNTVFERQPGTDQWHGGVIAALVDIAGCYVLTLLSEEPLPTINFRTDYLRPAIGTDLVAVAQVRKAGQRIGVVDIDINNDDNRLVAVGRGTYSMSPFSGQSNGQGDDRFNDITGKETQ